MTTDPTATQFIDGAWVPSSTGETRTITCPADGTEVGVVSEASTADTESAIAAARRAFDSRVWADRPAGERGDFLLDVAEQLRHGGGEASPEIALVHEHRAPRVDQRTRVPLLVIVGRVRQRDEDRGDPHGGEFGQTRRPGPAQREIAPAVGLGHVLDERDHPGNRPVEARRAVGIHHRLMVGLAGLMPDLEARDRLAQFSSRGAHRFVDECCGVTHCQSPIFL